MITIAPKFGSNFSDISDNLLKYVRGVVEIQMIGDSIQEAFDSSLHLIDSLSRKSDLKHVILHMPFGFHAFEVYLMSPSRFKELETFIGNVNRMSFMFSIKIGILFHVEYSIEFFEKANVYNKINHLESLTSNHNVYFLLENAFPCLSVFNKESIQSFLLYDRLNNHRVKICLDLCHAQIHENLLLVKPVVPDSIRPFISVIHFSKTLNKDGYRDKSTHGRVHDSACDIAQDIKYLDDIKALDNDVIFVTEISEKDYYNKPDMIKELDYLYECLYNCNLISKEILNAI